MNDEPDDSPEELVDRMFGKLDLVIKLDRQIIEQNDTIIKMLKDYQRMVSGVIEKRNEPRF